MENRLSRLEERKLRNLARVPTAFEVKEAMFNIQENKALGSNGISASFFRKRWQITGNTVVYFVQRTFRVKQVPSWVNNTLISLTPR